MSLGWLDNEGLADGTSLGVEDGDWLFWLDGSDESTSLGTVLGPSEGCSDGDEVNQEGSMLGQKEGIDDPF